MRQKEIVKKAIARLTDEEKFNYFKYLVATGYKTFEDVIEFATECYALKKISQLRRCIMIARR